MSRSHTQPTTSAANLILLNLVTLIISGECVSRTFGLQVAVQIYTPVTNAQCTRLRNIRVNVGT
jgi:hypothetical protein